MMIYGAEGAVLLDGNSYVVYDGKQKVVKEVKEKPEADPTDSLSATGLRPDQLHLTNFLDAIRGVQQATAPVDEAHKSVRNASPGEYSLARRPRTELRSRQWHIKGDQEAMKLWSRTYQPGWESKI